MAVYELIILICLWFVISIIVYHLVKIRSMLFDIRTSQCEYKPHTITEQTKYMPIFSLADYDTLKEIMKECLSKEPNIEFELTTIINNEHDAKVIAKNILDRYNITPKEKEE